MMNKINRVQKILDIALSMANKLGWQVSSRIEEIQISSCGYAEPGYLDPESGIIAIGNWNSITSYDAKNHCQKIISDLPKRIGKLFEKMGIPCEWSDEWSTCSDCGKLVRIEADSYSWTRSYHLIDDEIYCSECLKKDPKSYLESLENDDSTAMTIKSINPEDCGYVKFNKDSYESGWYPGQNDSPQKIAKELREKGITRFIFSIDSVGQFDTHWSLFIHKNEIDLIINSSNPDSDSDDDLLACRNMIEKYKNQSKLNEIKKIDVPCRQCGRSVAQDDIQCWWCETKNPSQK